MKNEEKVKCTECGNKNVVKKGLRKTRFAVKPIFKCNSCGKKFTLSNIKNNTYPAKIIFDSVSNYNLGCTLEESKKQTAKRFKVKVPAKTIYNWVKEFDKVCSYYRVRGKSIKLFKPKDIIFKKVFIHLQLYKYRYHKAKIELFVNKYFSGLNNYLINISENCPNELFSNSIRSSNVNLNIDISKVKVFKKQNYACKLASLALESASKNSERHDKLQEFMLVNDTCTIATEVPVYLFLDEVKQYGVFDLFENPIKNDALNIENNNENTSIKNNQNKNQLSNPPSSPPPAHHDNNAITGHIDFVQLKFGSVYVLDYKPNASKVDAVSQLFVYALALSIRPGIWLRNFVCAWFDENGYYEFAPSDMILRFCNVPKHKFREFFVRNKERGHFTSKKFQHKRDLRFWQRVIR